MCGRHGDCILISVVFCCDGQPGTTLVPAPTRPLPHALPAFFARLVAMEPLSSDGSIKIRLPWCCGRTLLASVHTSSHPPRKRPRAD
jgi:hypothetical protein